MCGIAGIIGRSPPDSVARVRAMLEAMRHRGPDGEGTLELVNGAAGMVRLALVDLSPRGQQPIWSPHGDVAILFNGEMYNFRDERSRLEKAGHVFRTMTDTEVVIHLYLEQGDDFVRAIRGMFALAIFDFRRGSRSTPPRVVFARDQLGIKPLYISRRGAATVFASELRAMCASGLVARELSPSGLRSYLRYGFVVQPETILAGVTMLDAGMTLVIEPDGAVFTKKFGGRVENSGPGRSWRSLNDAAAELRSTLEESVRLHALADAPVGAFLSGGVDSTVVAGLMRQHVPGLRTFTLEIPDLPGADEVADADAAASFLGLRCERVSVEAASLPALLPRFAGDLDQPSTDGLNTWLISRGASTSVKGVLSGLGGDEWFSGYPVAARMLRPSLPPPLGWAVNGVLQAAGDQLPGRALEHLENLAARRSPMGRWLQAHTVFWEAQTRALLGQRSPQTGGDPLQERQSFDEDPLKLCMQLDANVYMRSQLLRDSDATSMAHSLELRVPLVDVEVASYAARLPREYRMQKPGSAVVQKLVLRRATADLLPPALERKPKRGFALPFGEWLTRSLIPLVDDVCGPESVRSRNVLEPRAVDKLRAAARADEPRAVYPQLWSLLILELWCRSVLDVTGAAPTASAGIAA